MSTFPTVTLITGEVVSTWSLPWRRETYDRHLEMLRIYALPDRTTRRAHLARYIAAQEAIYAEAGHADPVACSIEAGRRMEAAILDHWSRRAQRMGIAG